MPDFLTAYYAAVCSLKDGEAAEVELCLEEQMENRTVILTVTLRREVVEAEAAT